MTYRYIDIHCHPNLGELKADQQSVIEKMREEGVAGIVIGVDSESSREAARLAGEYEHLFATVGLHPNYTQKEVFDRDAFAELLKQPKVVGVGECGLDYFRQSTTKAGEEAGEGWKEKQWEVFKQHVELALEHDKSLMIHCRPSKDSMDAYEEVAAYLESHVRSPDIAQTQMRDVGCLPLWGLPRHQERPFSDAEDAPTLVTSADFVPHANDVDRSNSRQGHSSVRGNMHFFVGNVEVARRFWRLGFTTSFTGVLTFTHDYDEVVREAPLDMILTETDAPYAAPVPHRGEVNQPVYVAFVTKKIADLKGESPETIQKAVLQNAERVFGVTIQG